MKQIETEIKYALTTKESKGVRIKLSSNGFKKSKIENLTDYFLKFQVSPVKGWDFTRLRVSNTSPALLTKKEWQARSGSEPIRIEREHSITKKVFMEMKNEIKGIPSIKKTRTNYKGIINGRKITISIDRLKVRTKSYIFIELEAITEAKESSDVRKKLADWFFTELGYKKRAEAPSMLDFLFTVIKPNLKHK